MYIIILILILTAIWGGYKMTNAKKVKGRKAEIRPFRQNSSLSPFGTFTVTLHHIQKRGNEVWFMCPLDKELLVGDTKFDFVMIRAKKDDDHFSPKKDVIAYVHIGHTSNKNPPQFIDWGLVRVL